MADIKFENIVKKPCESCIHNKVCSAKRAFEETEVKTTHPYVKVTLECTEFYAKPNLRELETPFIFEKKESEG
jgi:hypothetical protein